MTRSMKYQRNQQPPIYLITVCYWCRCLAKYWVLTVPLLLLLVPPSSYSPFPSCWMTMALSISSFTNRLFRLRPPSNTQHLEHLFLAFDQLQRIEEQVQQQKQQKPIIQNGTDIKYIIDDGAGEDDPKSSKLAYQALKDCVPIQHTKVASGSNVVAGKGLIAGNRDFDVGEVVALYLIHALGYANGCEPPVKHRPEEHCPDQDLNISGVVGTSDLICCQGEDASYFGVVPSNSNDTSAMMTDVDYSYTMLDPSGRYVFDVSPHRSSTSDNNFFLAHFVNDAAAVADLSVLLANTTTARTITATNEQTKQHDDAIAQKTIETAMIDYWKSSLQNMNCIMIEFGPSPLMAYVTTKPVPVGKEFLASYGLGYWLGKVGDDELVAEIETCLKNSPQLQQVCEIYDDAIDKSIDEALQVVLSDRYRKCTDILHGYIRKHYQLSRASSRRATHNRWRQRRPFRWFLPNKPR